MGNEEEPLTEYSFPVQVSLEWPLESICYTVRGPNQHELQPPPGGPGTFSVHFLDSEEAQQWAALVRDATAEGQNGQCCGINAYLNKSGLPGLVGDSDGKSWASRKTSKRKKVEK